MVLTKKDSTHHLPRCIKPGKGRLIPIYHLTESINLWSPRGGIQPTPHRVDSTEGGGLYSQTKPLFGHVQTSSLSILEGLIIFFCGPLKWLRQLPSPSQFFRSNKNFLFVFASEVFPVLDLGLHF